MLTLTLDSCGNPDFHGPKARKMAPLKTVEVQTLAEASAACRNYISQNGLGGGNWRGGQVYKDGQPYAYISYNGRAWLPGAVKNGKFQMSETPHPEA